MCDIEGCYRQAEWRMNGLKYDEPTEVELCGPCKNAFGNAFAWSGNTVRFELID